MKLRRIVLSFVSLFVLPLLLFQFQNCAPSMKSAEASGLVGIPDNAGKSQIQFVTNSVEVQDDVPDADVDGFCNSEFEGSNLRWAIWADNSSQPLLSGSTLCKSGRFKLNVPQMDQVVCGVSHMLVAEGAHGDSNFTKLTRRCQPLASQSMDPPPDSPAGTLCSLEYSPASEAEQQCAQVCYRDSKVVSDQAVEINQCSGLAASLAGP